MGCEVQGWGVVDGYTGMEYCVPIKVEISESPTLSLQMSIKKIHFRQINCQKGCAFLTLHYAVEILSQHSL